MVLILKPKDHERLTRHFYQTKEAIRTRGGPPVIEQGLILDLSLEERFDAVFFGSNMYSVIPLKEWRIAFLKRVGQHLAGGGVFYLEFVTDISPEEVRLYPIKKFFARMFGNRFYELGDSFFAGWHYRHSFGLEVAALSFEAGYAVLRGR